MSRRERDPAETIRARKGFLWFLVVLTMIIWIHDALALPVEYNPAGSPVPVKEMEKAIGYAVWALQSRLGLDVEYAGLTGETFEEGKIIVQWEDLWLTDFAPSLSAESLYSADLAGGAYRVGYATWAAPDGVLSKAKTVLNTYGVTKVDACLLETIVHELAHPLAVVPGHTSDKQDVMYPYRNECRYSLSLSDLDFIGHGTPLHSCHVELTPDGWLEYPDYNGKRIALAPLTAGSSLEPPRFGRWIWGSIDDNPSPQPCDGVFVQGGEVWAEVKGFGREPMILRLQQPGPGRFVSVPLSSSPH